MLKATSSVSSAKICSGVPIARLSSVGMIEPSIEFSIGTQANSALPSRTASSAAIVLSTGSGRQAPAAACGTRPAPVICRSAASVKVPAGPRYAMLATTETLSVVGLAPRDRLELSKAYLT